MKSTLVLAALIASTQALAGDFNYQNDIDPFGFDREPLVSSKSRAEVHADAHAALRAGEIHHSDHPTRAWRNLRSTKPREQVLAETREAARLGLLTSRGEAGLPQATPRQEEQIRVAGLRAIGVDVASN